MSATGAVIRWRVRPLFLLFLLVASAYFAVPARGGSPISLTIVSAPNGAADLVDIGNATYAATKAALDPAGVTSATVPLAVPGLPDPLTFAGALEFSDANASVSVVATGVSGEALFGSDSPLKALLVDAIFVADWDENDAADAAPNVAVAFKVDTIALDQINPLFSGVQGVVPQLNGPVFAFTPSAFDLNPSATTSAASGFFGPVTLSVGPVANVIGGIDLPSFSALESAVRFLGDNSSNLSFDGQIGNTAQLLVNPGAASQVDLEGLAISLRPDLSNVPVEWLAIDDATFTLGLGEGNAPFISLDANVTTTIGGASNSFVGSSDLQPSGFAVSLGLDGPFEAPFGLDWLQLSDISLSASHDAGDYAGSFHATADVPGLSPDPTVSISIAGGTDSSAGSVAVSGELSIADVVRWLTTSGGPFGGAGLDIDALDGFSLQQIVFSYADDGADRLVSFAAATEFGALDANFLLGLKQPIGGNPSLLVGLKVSDPLCGTQLDPCIRLGNVLPFLDGTDSVQGTIEGSPAGDIELPALDLLLVQSLDVNPSGNFNLNPAEFGAAAESFFSTLPDDVEVDLGLSISTDLSLDPLGAEVRDALGYPAESVVKLTGKIGGSLNIFDPAFDLSGFSLSATMPEISPMIPNLDVPRTTATLSIGYNDPDGSGGEPPTITFSVAFSVQTSVIGGPRSVDITASFSKTGDDFTVTMTGDLGAWDNAFGLAWLDLTSVILEVSFSQFNGETTLAAALRTQFDINGKTFAVDVEGQLGANPQASVTASLFDTITLGEILDGVGIDPVFRDGLPTFIRGASAGCAPAVGETTCDGGVQIVVTVSGSTIDLSTVAGFSFPLTEGGNPLSATVLLSLDSDGDLLVGLRPNGPLNLTDLVPDASIDFEFVSADSKFAVMYANDPIKKPSADLDSATRAFLAPLHLQSGSGDFEVDLRTGLGMLGKIQLPDNLAQFVGDTLALKPGVQLGGSLPILGSTELSLSLGLELDPDRLPEWLHAAGLELEVAGSPTSLSVGIAGTIAVKVKAGMDPLAADALGALGVDVLRADPVQPTDNCRNGTDPMAVDEATEADPEDTTTRYYCFDILEFEVGATLNLTPTIVDVTLRGSVTSLNGPWNPFGIEWLGVNQLIVELGLGVVIPTAAVNVSIGFLGDVELGLPPNTKDLVFAAKLGINVVAYPPFAIPSFKGIRMETAAGLEIQDIADLANAMRKVGDPDAEPFTVDTNVAIRNLQFSLSPLGVDSLCIPLGFVIGGDLYINPTDYEPTTGTTCDGVASQPKPPPPEEQCLNRKDDGCVASAFFSIGRDGISALAQLAGFEVGPFRWDDANLDIAIALGDTHFRISGGAEIFVGAAPDDTVLAGGDLAVELRPFGFDFFGRMEVYGFSALVDGSASLELLKDPANAGIRLHVMLAAEDADLGDPSFNTLVSAAVSPLFSGIRTTFLVADGVLVDAASLDFAVIVQNLPNRLRAANIAVPEWADDLRDALGPVLEELPTDFAGDAVDVVLNGITLEIPGVELGYTQVCFQSSDSLVPGIPIGDNCWKVPPVSGILGDWRTVFGVRTCFRSPSSVLPGIVIGGTCWRRVPVPGVPGAWRDVCVGTEQDGKCWVLGFPPRTFSTEGVCDELFSPAAFPDLRQNGRCQPDRLVDSVIIPLFDAGIQAIAEGAPTIAELRAELRQELLDAQTLFEFACLDFDLALTASNQFVFLGLEAIVYDRDVAFEVGWDFGLPLATNANALAQGVFGSFTGNPVSVCDEVVIPGTTVIPPSGDSAQIGGMFPASSVPEGTEVTFNGTFDVPTAEDRAIDIDWRDGTSDSVDTVAGATSFAATHTFADDDAPGLSRGVASVELSDPASPMSPIVRPITVLNVAPAITALTADAAVDENGLVTLTGSFTDPGADAHTMEVLWNDGSPPQTVELPIGARTFEITHVYIDDAPTGTAADVASIKVSVKDDDGGADSDSVAVTVSNVAPSGLELDSSAAVVFEGAQVLFTVEWDDPGRADTHVVTVDWGDGTVEVFDVPAGTLANPVRTFSAFHDYVDDDPSDTPQDTYMVSVTVDDDDLGSNSATFPVTVVNVDPVLGSGDPSGDIVVTPGDATVNENDTVELFGWFTDPGIADSHSVQVDWGDGTVEIIALAFDASEPVRTFEAAHQYLDDDPSGTAADSYTINVALSDDDTGTDSTVIDVVVNDVAPDVAVDPTAQETQYSDPIGDVVFTATDVAADTMTAETWWGSGATANDPGLPPWLQFSADDNCTVDTASNQRACTWTLSAVPDPASGVHTDAAPGDYTVRVRITDDDTLTSDITTTITVLPEDAVALYVGPVVATAVNAGEAEIILRANVREISSLSPASDAAAGDIGHATVTFRDEVTGDALCTAPVIYLFGDDDSIGTALCSHSFGLGVHGIDVIVGDRYTNVLSPEATVLTVSLPGELELEGGGQLLMADSVGLYDSDGGTTTKFNFGVELDDGVPAGIVKFTVLQDGRKYEIRSTGFISVGASGSPGSGQIQAIAKITDITNKNDKVLLTENLLLQVFIRDSGDDDDGEEGDAVSFAVLGTTSVTAQLWHSSNFDGFVTQLQELHQGGVEIEVESAAGAATPI